MEGLYLQSWLKTTASSVKKKKDKNKNRKANPPPYSITLHFFLSQSQKLDSVQWNNTEMQDKEYQEQMLPLNQIILEVVS